MKKISKKILASALALAMTVAGSVVTFADPNAPMPTPSTEVAIDGDTITVTVSASGDFEGGFDYGIAYDATKVEVDDFNLADEFTAFLKNGQGIDASNLFADKAYVVLGGVTTSTNKKGETVDTTYAGVVGSVVFKVLDGVDATTAQFAAVTNSADKSNELTGDQTLLDKVIVDEPDVVKTPAPVATETPETPAPTDDGTEAPAPTDNNGGPTGGGNAPAAPTDNNGDPKSTGAPAPKAPTTSAPATASPSPKASPKTGDAGVVLPIVAICGAAAAVAVASKKKVED